MSDEMIQFVPDPVDPAQLRRAFGRFGTGVTVVTTMSDKGPLGMTANSFSSVSLNPALILWSPARSSERHDSFAQAKSFCLHFLALDQEKTAGRFAKDGLNFDGVDWAPGDNGAPLLKACVAAFQCDTFAVHPAGDHSIIVGQVMRVSITQQEKAGLMFEGGQFGHFRAH